MAVETIAGAWTGTLTVDPDTPSLVALDAAGYWYVGSFAEWDWHGPESTPMPYPPTPGTGWLQNDLIFDPLTVELTVNTLTADGSSVFVDGMWIYSEPDGTVVGGLIDWSSGAQVTDVTVLPATLTGPVPQSLGRYHHLVLWIDTATSPSRDLTVTLDVDWVITRIAPDPAPGGIRVGQIILGGPTCM